MMRFDVHYFLSEKHAKYLIISLISFFSLLTLREYSTLFFISSQQEISTATKNEGSPQPIRQNVLDSLLNSSLFGVYLANDVNGDHIKKSMLNITLVGVLLGDKASNSQVIIRDASGAEKNYKVNDKIAGSSLIKRIMPSGILVEHHGNLEKVSLPNDELTFEPVAKPLRND